MFMIVSLWASVLGFAVRKLHIHFRNYYKQSPLSNRILQLSTALTAPSVSIVTGVQCRPIILTAFQCCCPIICPLLLSLL